jgi:hypothetical protein
MKLFMIPVIRAHLARQVNSESSHTLSRSFETTFWSYDYLFVFFFDLLWRSNLRCSKTIPQALVAAYPEAKPIMPR